MARIRSRGEDVRRFILKNVEAHPNDIAKVTSRKFGISRQAVNKHLQKLVSEKALSRQGKTRNLVFKLSPQEEWSRVYHLAESRPAEDIVWREDIYAVLAPLPENITDIWHYGFTEMFNNVLDHAEGSEAFVVVRKTAVDTEMMISDNGTGIFKKIQRELSLLDECHAIFELAKGKLTTDPKHHSGEGIFFTSRMFDSFDILSGGVYFTHAYADPEDWIMERTKFESGTTVWMKLHNHTARTVQKVFDKFSSGDDYGFNKTVVPVRLAQYGSDKLISRSQAKRVLARVELFRTVIFDFKDVPVIGQAFADEIFRVFGRAHKDIELIPVHANSQVKRIISRARSASV